MIGTYHIARKFGGELNLTSVFAIAKLKSANASYSHIYVHVAIPYRTAKF